MQQYGCILFINTSLLLNRQLKHDVPSFSSFRSSAYYNDCAKFQIIFCIESYKNILSRKMFFTSFGSFLYRSTCSCKSEIKIQEIQVSLNIVQNSVHFLNNFYNDLDLWYERNFFVPVSAPTVLHKSRVKMHANTVWWYFISFYTGQHIVFNISCFIFNVIDVTAFNYYHHGVL